MKKFLLIIIIFLSLTSPAHAGFKVIAINPALKSGLVGHWTLDANKIDFTGGSVTDSSIEGNTGTIQGSIPIATGQVPGKFNTAVKFNGTTEFIGLGDDSSLQITTGTISAWVKTSSGGSDYRAVVVKQNAYGMFLKNNVFMIYDWGGGGDRSSGVNLGDNIWHHIACSFRSGVSSGTLCYVDGVLRMTTTMTVAGPSSEVRIASAGSGAVNQPISASIDDVRVYNKVLSAAEISNLYRQFTTEKIKITSSASPGTLASGLVGHWTFDGGKLNQNVGDSSGQGNHGRLSGIAATSSAVTEGKIGQGLKFDGVNDYVELGSNFTDTSTAYTIAAWVYYTSTARMILLSKGDHATSPTWIGFEINHFEGGAGKFGVRAKASDTGIELLHAPGLTPNRWNHVVIRRNSATKDDFTMYLNGASVAVTSESSPSAFGPNPTTFVQIGARSASGAVSLPLAGTLDDVRIYNRALSAAEVTALYRMGVPNKQNASSVIGPLASGLVGHWTFDGGKLNWATGAVTDSSGTGNVGSMKGTMSTTTAPTEGKIGQGLKLDGVNDYVSVADNATLDGFSKASWSFWIKPNRLTGTYYGVIDKRTNASSQNSWSIGFNYGGTILSTDRFGIQVSTDGGCCGASFGEAAISTSNFTVGTWHHVVVTFDKDAATNYAIYVNGTARSLAGSDDVDATLFNSSAQVSIGSINEGAAEVFPGSMDDVRIYSRALSAGEVKALYRMGR